MVCCGYRECVLLINVSSTDPGFLRMNERSFLLFQATNHKLYHLTNHHIDKQVWLRHIRPYFIKTQLFRYDYDRTFRI